MAIKISAAGGGHFFRKQNLDLRMKPVLLAAALFAVYAIIGIISTAGAQGNSQCNIEPARREVLHRAAKGFFTALRVADESYYAGEIVFQDSQNKNVKLADFKGKTLLVNLWAVWCVPCRDEMPELAALQKKLGKSSFDVLAINVDRSADNKIRDFLENVQATNLAVYRDKSMKTFQTLKHEGFGLGLPITLLVDPQGCVLASFNGSAPWANQDAVAFIEATMKTGR